jgi:hypothetical protein
VLLAPLAGAGCGSSSAASSTQHDSGARAAATSARRASTSMSGMPKAVPITPIGTATWDGMKIMARMSGPSTFTVPTGSRQKVVKPSRDDTGHLMVMLTDAGSGVPIPYSSVWATVRLGGKIIFDERQWPMISRTMGPHYGNNVALPRAGRYQLTLLISPPQAARHMEYQGRWSRPHRVTMSFHWDPAS